LGAAFNAMLAQIETAFDEKSVSEARLRQFVADASHELRTPLTSIRGYAELLRKGGFPDAVSRERALSRVEHEAARMGSLVDDLLLLARLDQGRSLRTEAVDLAAVARDAVEDARAVDPDRPILLGGEVSVIVAGDRDGLGQVAHNLVRNALVHTPPGSPVGVDVTSDGTMGTIRVRDEGPGLPPWRAEQVFDRFFRGDVARSRGGTGLGLSIVRAIAEAAGGNASVESRPGEGATFTVSIPLDPHRADPAATPMRLERSEEPTPPGLPTGTGGGRPGAQLSG
jgi:two-component system OmpR family sensor kinase